MCGIWGRLDACFLQQAQAARRHHTPKQEQTRCKGYMVELYMIKTKDSNINFDTKKVGVDLNAVVRTLFSSLVNIREQA